MLRAIERLVREQARCVGNHSVERTGEVDRYYYFATAICTVYHATRSFSINHGGWFTRSTNRAIKDYREYFAHTRGYMEDKTREEVE